MIKNITKSVVTLATIFVFLLSAFAGQSEADIMDADKNEWGAVEVAILAHVVSHYLKVEEPDLVFVRASEDVMSALQEKVRSPLLQPNSSAVYDSKQDAFLHRSTRRPGILVGARVTKVTKKKAEGIYEVQTSDLGYTKKQVTLEKRGDRWLVVKEVVDAIG